MHQKFAKPMPVAGCDSSDLRQTESMAQRPPQETYRRIRRLSGMNGWSVAVFAGLCALVSLAFGQLVGAAVSAIVAYGGFVELRGRRLLQRRDIDGMRLLVQAQLIVLGAVWVYAMSRLASFDAGLALSNVTPEMNQVLTEAGIDTSQLLQLIKLVFYSMYSAVMVATLLYQGGLAWYYRRRTAVVQQALTEVTLPARSTS